MSRILSHLLVFAGLSFLLTGDLYAQSQNAYLRAGDACMEKQDPFCALACYRQALDYGDDALTFLKLSSAETALFNYRTAEQWIRKSMSAAAGMEMKSEI